LHAAGNLFDEASVAPARISEPTGTGDVNLTLFEP